ncbi:MAG TPA: hypothetical protein VGQ57_12145 [Polyangiaceae bacterium]|jgi:hypothetical protein|nr:hypothetical protein [Polyangiaceae bacterium]
MLHRASKVRRNGTFLRWLSALGLASAVYGCSPATTPGTATPAAASTGSGNAPPASGDAARAGRASLFVVNAVNDFPAFQKYFEDGAAERAKAGIKGYLLSKLDDGRVVIHFFADDPAAIDRALRSPELDKYLDRKGTPDSSLVWLTRDVFVKLPAAPPGGQTYSLYLKLKVGDFAALERGFSERLPVFAEQGVIAEGLHQSTSNDDVAVLHFVGSARDKLEALPARREFTELLTLARSEAPPRPLVGVDVARDRPQ